ncbi:dihydrolipoyl dehydrogenase family protein [Anoxynatronum buryatiense]|uniref:Pyruvate/2-oxoglutarate dehydrogenase complex, dihydrolipoamide dehydrogenase (E3) component n=1 Tax=Anoxynatronum buryatiense TaxID=489973 RepID=A0AA45WXV4_9CLOT|nr:FAD-dependent oxidoreductase [Anoxynatronum buryatiense]SMP66323.1 Pyruvate/2-oxoglutarate dehydrogenase complex, dihydrolipoamide dehydrogenase (E3) component [Anoxynatronum buryatiense]
MDDQYHVIVIGGGSAGLVTAGGAAALGAKVALIEGNEMGGDCLNTGCVPSKALLASAHLANWIRQSEKMGLDGSLAPVNLEKVMNRVHRVIEEIAPHDSVERFQSMGVEVIQSHGRLLDAYTVQAGDRVLTGKRIVITAGSGPQVPKLEGLDKVGYLTNETLFSLEKLPEHLMIWGAGPIAMEIGQAFVQLGSRVTVILRGHELFKKDEPEVGEIMARKLEADGIRFLYGCDITGVSREGSRISLALKETPKDTSSVLEGDAFLIALGRRPASAGMGLEVAGVKTDRRGFVVVNETLQTSQSHIYACGDIAGPHQFTHMAGYQAGIVVRNLFLSLKKKVDYRHVVWTTYTSPQVAHAGYAEKTAKEAGLLGSVITHPFREVDRAIIENDREGLLKLVLDRKKRVIGATLVCEQAGEMISLASLAIVKKLKVSDFMNIIYAYPTKSEIFGGAALTQLKDSFKPWQKKLFQWLFLP